MLLQFIKKITKKNSYFWDLIFYFVLIFLFFRFWKNQLAINYIDYGEGSYLYESLLINKNLLIYRDFFAPQPPIIYFIGSFLLKLSINPLIIKYFLFILFVSSNILLFYLLNIFFKDKKFSFFVIIVSTFFTNTIYWWPTFTGETFLRFFIILFLFYFLPIEKNNKKKLFIGAFFLNLILFTKFTSIFFIIFTFLFLLIIDKKLFFDFIKYFFILFTIFLVVLLSIFENNFLYQTIFIRNILPFKNYLSYIPSTTIFLIKYIPFFLLNLIFGIVFFRKKLYSKSFLFFIYCFWFPSVIFNFFEGTYLYIFYPVEVFLSLGFGFIVFNYKKIKFKILSIIVTFSSFWSLLVVIYQIQVLDNNYFLASNHFDKKTTQNVIEIIKNKTKENEFIIAPPFFAFFSNRYLFNNFHDPFIFYYYLLSKNKYPIFEESLNLIKKNKPKLIISDWRIKKSLILIDKNYFLDYKKIGSFYFLNNQYEYLDVYVKNN